mmetsp:Transcript_20355/g.39068  ORF Transcript_20355/g.39068 Transcript_20355/m.39068 type:complete len:142 (+) Transcript_20355:68-493(+)
MALKLNAAIIVALTAFEALADLKRNGAPPLDPCAGITCTPVSCREPFVVKTAAETGMCCDICDTDSVEAREDRSWTEGMTGGVGPATGADVVLCRGVVCPKPLCEDFEQTFDGRCCMKCPASKIKTLADFKMDYKKKVEEE